MDDDARILRLSTAICCAPLLGAAACAAGLAIALAFSGGYYDVPSLIGLSIVAGAWFGFIFGLPAMLLIGLPTHAWLAWTRRTSLGAYAMTGTLPGILAAIALMHWLPPPPDVAAHILYAILGAVTGAISAAFFWLIRRPDIGLANPATPPA